MEKFEIKSENIKNKNPEHSLENRENNEIPEQRYIDVCKKMGTNLEIVNDMCKNNFEIYIREGLEAKGISFDKILKNKVLNLA